MAEFFRGWKRRIGVVALVMACGLAGAWMRSWSYCDDFCLISYAEYYHVFSADSQLSAFMFKGLPEVPGDTWYSQPLTADRDEFPYRKGDRIELPYSRTPLDIGRYHSFAGLAYGERRDSGMLQTMMIQIPYWSIVAPFTLISAWLLLNKPRQAQPK